MPSLTCQRGAALALLRHRIEHLPGLEIIHQIDDGEALYLAIDVTATGFTGRQVRRMVRMLGGVDLAVLGPRVVEARFDATGEIAELGTRLLFGLSHASHAPHGTGARYARTSPPMVQPVDCDGPVVARG